MGKTLIKSIVSGGLIFILGFGIMNIFWYFDIKDTSILGLYDFRAATVGDGICLPFIVGSALYYILSNKPLHGQIKERKTSFRVGIIMAIIAICVQASWLISDKTVPNWTIPYVHYFNAAGWYHAIFFVFMFFIIGFLLSRIWLIRHKNQNEKTSIENIVSMAFM